MYNINVDSMFSRTHSEDLLGGCTVKTFEVDGAGARASVAPSGFSSTTLTAFAGTARDSFRRLFVLDAQQETPTAGGRERNFSCPSCTFRLSARDEIVAPRRNECSKDKPSKRRDPLDSGEDVASMADPDRTAGVRAAAMATRF